MHQTARLSAFEGALALVAHELVGGLERAGVLGRREAEAILVRAAERLRDAADAAARAECPAAAATAAALGDLAAEIDRTVWP